MPELHAFSDMLSLPASHPSIKIDRSSSSVICCRLYRTFNVAYRMRTIPSVLSIRRCLETLFYRSLSTLDGDLLFFLLACTKRQLVRFFAVSPSFIPCTGVRSYRCRNLSSLRSPNSAHRPRHEPPIYRSPLIPVVVKTQNMLRLCPHDEPGSGRVSAERDIKRAAVLPVMFTHHQDMTSTSTPMPHISSAEVGIKCKRQTNTLAPLGSTVTNRATLVRNLSGGPNDFSNLSATASPGDQASSDAIIACFASSSALSIGLDTDKDYAVVSSTSLPLD